MVSQQPSSVGRIHFSSVLNWHEIPNKNNMTAIGILNYVRKKYKYPAGCLWPRRGSKAKHPRVSGSRPNVRNGHNPRAWVTISVQNVPKRWPGPGSPASLGLITDFYQRKTQNCTFENHRAFPLSVGAGNGCAAVGGRRGCEGLRWLFIHEGFGAGFALTGARGFEVCPDAALGMSVTAWGCHRTSPAVALAGSAVDAPGDAGAEPRATAPRVPWSPWHCS